MPGNLVSNEARASRPIQRAKYGKAAAVEHMGIDLRGLHIRMAEQFLHRADVLPGFEQMRGKRMAKGMRRSGLIDTNPTYCITNRALNGFLMQMMAIDAFGAWILCTRSTNTTY